MISEAQAEQDIKFQKFEFLQMVLGALESIKKSWHDIYW